MTTDSDQAKLLTILLNHQGKATAISVADVAEAMGLDRGKSGTRRVQELKRALVEQGYPIGSCSARIGGGYYLAVNEGELLATIKQYANRFYSISVLIKRMRGMLRKPEPTQQTLTWGD